MQRGIGALVVAAVLVACGGAEAPGPSGGEGAKEGSTAAGTATLAHFEASFDVASGAWTLAFRSPSGEIAPQAVGVTIPWATSGASGAYLHTRQAFWTSGAPSTMNVGVSAENLYTMPINGFTAVVDSITPSTVGVCNVVQSGTPLGNNCGTGSVAATWSCASGSATKSSPGVAPCRLGYGTVNHTGADPAGAGDVASDPGVPRPWFFVDPTSANFSIKGHVEGTSVPTH